jgi:hypothetical protein
MTYLVFDLCEHWRIRMVEDDEKNGLDTVVCLIDKHGDECEFGFHSERKALVCGYCERVIMRNDHLSRFQPDEYAEAIPIGGLT